MSQIKMDSEDIATIKNALKEQAKRIDKLLPDVKFEGGKQCQQ